MGVFIEYALKEIKSAARAVCMNGWGEAYAGNFSIRLEESEDFGKDNYFDLTDSYEHLRNKTIVITSSMSRMRQLSGENTEDLCSVITINGEGTGYYLYGKKPSSELTVHLMLHNEYEKNKKNIRSIVHCHPDEIIALLHLTGFKTKETVNKMLFSIHSEIQLIIPDGVAVPGSHRPGSYELAEAVFKELKKREIALLAKHGCIAVGEDLNSALDKIEAVNKAVKIYFMLKSLR